MLNNEQSSAPIIKINFNMFFNGSMIAFIVQPFEVIRTTAVMSTEKKNTVAVFREIFQKEGLKGLFRGGHISIFRTGINSCIFFTGIDTFRYNEAKITQYISHYQANFLAGILSECISAFTTNPLSVLKTRYEAFGTGKRLSLVQGFKDIYVRDSFWGYYRGLYTSLLRDLPYSGIQVCLYSFFSSFYKNNSNKQSSLFLTNTMLSAMISHLIANIITHPFDNIRVRLMCLHYSTVNYLDEVKNEGLGHSPKLLKSMSTVIEREGFFGLYKGMAPRLLKKMVLGGISWCMYESNFSFQKNDDLQKLFNIWESYINLKKKRNLINQLISCILFKKSSQKKKNVSEIIYSNEVLKIKISGYSVQNFSEQMIRNCFRRENIYKRKLGPNDVKRSKQFNSNANPMLSNQVDSSYCCFSKITPKKYFDAWHIFQKCKKCQKYK